jgi:hypothetical protein
MNDSQCFGDNFLDQLMKSREHELNNINIKNDKNIFQQLAPVSNAQPAQNNLIDQLMKSGEQDLNNNNNNGRTIFQQPFPVQDNFLDKLIKNREKDFQTYSPDHVSINLGNNIELPAEDGIDIFEELKKTKIELDADFNQHQNALKNKLEQSENLLLNALAQQRNNDYLKEISKEKEPIKKTPNVIKEQQPKEHKEHKVLNYPLQYHQNPIWHQMNKIIKEKDAPRRLVAILLASPLADYPIVYSFVRFSDALDGKKEKELRATLIKSILEVQKHLVRMLQLIWGQKQVKSILLLMSQWKIAEYCRDLKK